jgi:hypothetical protein
MSDTVIRVENISKLYRLGEVGTGSLAHDVNRWWHKVQGKEDPYLKIGEVNDRTKSVSSVERPESSAKKTNLTTEDTESTEVGAEARLAGQAGGALSNPSTSELAQDSENTSLIRSANSPHSSEEQSDSKALDSRPSTARLWSLDFLFHRPRLWSLVSRLSEGPAFGLGLRAEGCFV